jgi:carboxylate-amine ligase
MTAHPSDVAIEPDLSIGATVGVEEEYHLVDPITFSLAPRPLLSEAVASGREDPRLRAEMVTSQLEAVTDVCRTLTELRASLVAARHAARTSAEQHSATILATSTHPFARLEEIDIMRHPRYARLVDRFGAVVRQFNLCGCHVHVSMPDLDTAVQVSNHARPYLPLLVAMTGSSPFHEGGDTGHASYRMALLRLWPHGGPPPLMANGAEYLALLEDLRRTGLIDEPNTLLWELRPSSRYPTLEFRMPDVCTDLDDAVLLAALVRSLSRTLGKRIASGTDAPNVPDALLASTRWRAARYGLTGDLWSQSRGDIVEARVAVEDMLAELSDDLRLHGEYDVVSDLAAALLTRGTSADRQRAVAARAGDLRAVAADAAALTCGG